ncbi:MAG: PAS domain S-box protein [Tildeniella torsiva UHER 1998/13D]|jgi:PAS domain S-box-containing protein|nr:PAS domain S-box protein [Tildeniella torsiva UHER 1998/13D]
MAQHQQVADHLFGGGGEMGALMRSYDWATTPFGAVEQWPQSLRSTLSICLNSRFPMAIYWGPDCWLLYNDAWRPIVGDKHPWSLGRPAYEVWPEIWDDISPDFARVFATGEGVFHSDTLLVMHRFGYDEECFFDYTFNPIQGEGGRIDGILNVVSETTYRVLNDRRAQLLRELASRTGIAKTVDDTCALMAEALESGPVDIPLALLYIVNADGKTACLCGGTASALGLPTVLEQVDLTVEDDAGSWPIASVAQTGQSRTLDDLVSRFGHLPGSPWPEPPEEAVVLPILVPGQAKAAGVLVAVANPRRRLDEVYRDFLEQIAGQIATAIANARSHEEDRRRADKLAELDRAKTVFFSNVSHEFRTPLTLMLGPVEEALQDTHDATQRQRLELVYRNALRLQKLVNTLLDFSRIEAGRIEASYEPTDLALLTADLAGVFQSAVEQAGLRLSVDCPPLVAPAYVDRDMWEKIVLNLLSNALKFTFEGEIAVTLHGGPDQIQLEVRDTGTGVPPEEIPHIFDRFHRVQGARGRTHEGSGIGLSLVQELVGLHGGTIAVASQVDQGTCFTITLPVGYDHLPSDRIASPKENRLQHGETEPINGPHPSTATGATPYLEEALRWHPTEPTNPSSTLPISPTLPNSPSPLTPSPLTPHILLADDNADMLDYVKRLLSPQYTIETARDGRAAIAAIRQQRPDLVLTDVMMPEMDGFELLRQLRADAQTQDLPIILLSARAGEESRIEGLAAGADDYLIKPFSARELLAKVEAALKLAQLRQAAKTTLQRSEERSRLAIRVAQLGTWRYDLCSDLVDLDERMQEIWGESATPLPILQVRERIHPSDRDRVMSAVNAALDPSSAGTYEIDYRIVWDDGTERWIMVSGQVIFAGEGESRQAVELLGTAIDITDRKRMESNLRESEERFRSMADNAPVMIWVTDSTGYCTYLSQSWYDFTGQTEETGLGLGWLEAVHPDDQAMSSQTFLTANRLQQGFQLEYRLRHKDGTYRWAIDAASPWLGADGQFKGYIGSVLDIGDRKQIEEALRQRETELRLVTNAVPALIAFVDADQRYRFNNQGYEDWFNQSATDLYGKHIREVVGDAAYENVRPYIEQVLAGQPVTFERSISFKDGSIRYLSATYVPRFNDAGVVEGFVALINDLSDRRQAEEALMQSEERYRYLVETIPQLVWTANAEGVLIDANQRWCAFTGLTVEQVETVGWPAVVHPDDIPILSQNWAIAQQQGTSYQAEGRMRRADGVYRWHLHQAIPLKTNQGRVIKWFGTATDIEDQKQLEQQRSQLLLQEQAARAAAEAASRTKDEFLAVVSHELRSPLNPILGWATLLQNGTLDEAKTKQALAVIERNAKLQTELIDDLLDVSRMLRGKLQISASPVNLAAIIRAAMETVRLAADAKSIRIEAHLEDEVGLVSGDATRLQQVVWNLLSNAVKFTPAAGRVEVRLTQGKANQAQITVTDSGKGVVPEFLPLIFDYFRQADSATTRQFGGLGLGLAIVRHLVELHGGTIQAASPGEGLGATFTVSLPTLTHSPLAPNDDLQPQPSLNLPGTQILVVDDDSDTRTFITFLLEQAGASVVAAASAREGLAALGQSRPQVLVSDIGMPDMDGYMLMRQIRSLPAEQGGQVPAIALTAYVRETDQEQALAAGFQRHIAKPVEPAALLRAIAELLQIQS